ncbi:prolyl-tRNA synthetase associated domain-containing protein [Companilactobacillus paralimentarius]|uniref:prolyl-tRNA synthetase associated domain-containing protein n=1 Tax=Companilactobacillus paralimentarius TaxID=83526 RepID=UPI00384B81BC
MEPAEQVEQALDKMNIEYQIVHHAVAHTTEEADHFIEGIEGVRTKTMFLTNKKKKECYLLVMDDAKRLDFRQFEELTGAKRPKMAHDDMLKGKLGLEPGIVSIFGLLNNTEHDVKVYFDSDILSEARMSFHPNINTSTIFVASDDVLKFVKNLGYEYHILNLAEDSEY